MTQGTDILNKYETFHTLHNKNCEFMEIQKPQIQQDQRDALYYKMVHDRSVCPHARSRWTTWVVTQTNYINLLIGILTYLSRLIFLVLDPNDGQAAINSSQLLGKRLKDVYLCTWLILSWFILFFSFSPHFGQFTIPVLGLPLRRPWPLQVIMCLILSSGVLFLRLWSHLQTKNQRIC